MINQYSRKTYLVGAGISMDGPSYLPSAYGIIELAYNHIFNIHSSDTNSISWPRLKNKLNDNQLRFERVIEIICSLKSDIDILAAIKEYTEPNLNHYSLARLAIAGHYIFTTNFDDLLERAIYNLGYTPITICTKRDYESFLIQDLSAIPVFKLHGSYYKYNGNKNDKVVSQRSIQASLPAIISQNSKMLLPTYKEKILETCILNSSQLVFLGYSGSDDFDIMPTLQGLNLPSVLWINHNNRISKKNALNKYTSEDNERKNFLVKNKDHCLLYDTNTRCFLQEEAGTEDFILNTGLTNGQYFEKAFDKWEKSLSDNDKKYLAGKLLMASNLYEDAGSAFSTINSDYQHYSDCIEKRITCYEQRSMYEEAWGLLSSYKSQNPQNTHNKSFLSVEAYIRWKKDPSDISIQKCYDKIFDSVVDSSLSFWPNTLNNYGLYLRDCQKTKEALICYRKCYIRAGRQGNIQLQSWVRNNQATLYYDLGWLNRALKACFDGYEKAKRLNDIRQMGVMDNLYANILYIKGDIKGTIEYCKRSIRCDKSIDNLPDSSINELLLGQCYLESNKYQQSKQHFDKAEKLFAQTTDKYFLYELIFYKTMFYIKAQSYTKASTTCHSYAYDNNNPVAVIYTNIARNAADYFDIGTCISFSNDLEDLYNSPYRDMAGYANIIYYLSHIGIPKYLIGEHHRKRARTFFKKVGNYTKGIL